MKFTIFHPPSTTTKTPVLYFLSGLTCTHENFIQKANAIQIASEMGIALVCPDTSPRGISIPGDDDSWDFGQGAGFYVDATEKKWAPYQMYSYIVKELPGVVNDLVNVDHSKVGIFGHSMGTLLLTSSGGHGALIIGLKNPEIYKSISAFAPIANPIASKWGIKAFTGYLGADVESWKHYDASELVKTYSGPKRNVLVDVGSDDNFANQGLLLCESLKPTQHVGVELRVQQGYDHSYWFIQTFVKDHIKFHVESWQL